MGYSQRRQMKLLRTEHILTVKVGWDVAGFQRDVMKLPQLGRITDIVEGADGVYTIECVVETPD